MRVIVCSDLHADAGTALGTPDAEYGNSRLRDCKAALEQIATAADGADGLVIAGDIARTPRPAPVVYRTMIDALRGSQPRPTLILQGNHDHLVEGGPHHVLARGLGGMAIDKPQVVRIAKDPGIQIGFLPWTPPSRMFERKPNDPAELHKLVGDMLAEVAVGLAEQVNPDLPSMLVVHWLASGPLFQLPEVMRGAEPVIDVQRLEVGPWDVILFGHYHHHLQIGPKSWYIGAPMRSGFGEEDLQPGFIEVEWAGEGTGRHEMTEGVGSVLLPRTADVRHIPLEDRPLHTADLTELPPGTGKELVQIDPCEGAIVRLRYSCTKEQVGEWAAYAERVVALLYEAGAAKVIGPQVTVITEAREVRSDLTVTVDPLHALEWWMEHAGVPEGLRDDVALAATLVVGADGV